MRLLVLSLTFVCLMGLSPKQGYADEVTNSHSYKEIQDSVNGLEKDWDNTRKQYAKRFKDQLGSINQGIEELKNALDNGDPAKRKKINEEMEGLKKSRDAVRQLIHEITATSIVKLSALQKYFINAKDDTKD